MQRGSSVNFQPVHSATHAVTHASREVAPTYLLPPEHSMGTIVLLDDKGSVSRTLEAKMALASRQAKAVEGYSPLWEGVLNLRRPEINENPKAYKKECGEVVKEWCKKYQEMTGHKVLRVDVHLDEGHMIDGVAMLNAHAHIICDKTNENGRVKKITPQKLRELQTATAKITNLERGVNSRISGKKHITAHQYKYLAERGQLESQVKLDDLKVKHEAELTQLQAQYRLDREALKASGEATQQAYMALKKAHEAALAEAAKVPGLAKQVTDTQQQATKQAAEAQALIAQYQRDREALKASGEAKPDPVPRTSQSIQQAVLTPPEAIKTAQERLAASYGAMMSWIRGVGGKYLPVDTSINQNHIGPVVQLDEMHAVQHKGRGQYSIHKLSDLDRVPGLDDPRMIIRYRDGVGHVTGGVEVGVGR